VSVTPWCESLSGFNWFLVGEMVKSITVESVPSKKPASQSIIWFPTCRLTVSTA
jgi:hypothetical protein